MSRFLQFLKSVYNYSYLKCCYEMAVYTNYFIWNYIFCMPNPAKKYNDSME
jgi:hypothetical protein